MAKDPPSVKGLSRAQARKARERYWRAVVAEQRRSGLNRSAFCRERGIAYHCYTWWLRQIARGRRSDTKGRRRQRVRAAARPQTFLPVRVVEKSERSSTSVSEYPLVLELAGGRRLHIDASVGTETLRKVLSVLDERPC